MKFFSTPSLYNYVSLGLVFWSATALIYGLGYVALICLVGSVVFFYLFREQMTTTFSSPYAYSPQFIIGLIFIYLITDAIFGRQLIRMNMFLYKGAVDTYIESINADSYKGRGAFELLANLFVFLPFFLLDLINKTSPKVKYLFYSLAMIPIVYESGISRGQFIISVMAILLPNMKNTLHFMGIISIGVLAFVSASYFRGDFDSVALGNPALDAYLYPIINLELLLESGCQHYNSADFVIQTLNKFIPGFLFDKIIFPFNVEMTKCIYPFQADVIQSISVFTWVGEIFIYQPSSITLIFALTYLFVILKIIYKQTVGRNLSISITYVGLMSVVLLRSRIQDLFSFLIFFIIFIVSLNIVDYFLKRLKKLKQLNAK